jgi:hypothetical protein
MPDSCEKHPYRGFLAEFSGDIGYRLLISLLIVIRPSDYDLKYHFGPKMLECNQKKLYVSRFPQLVFVMTSPLLFIYKISIIDPILVSI